VAGTEENLKQGDKPVRVQEGKNEGGPKGRSPSVKMKTTQGNKKKNTYYLTPKGKGDIPSPGEVNREGWKGKGARITLLIVREKDAGKSQN